MATESDKKRLLAEIEALKTALQDAEAALPAHSVRPSQYQRVEELEEALEAKRRELKDLT